MKQAADKVKLVLSGSADEGTGPSFDDLMAMTRQLTGREPTPDEIKQARAVYDGIEDDEKKRAGSE